MHRASLSTVQSLRTFYFPEEARREVEVCTGLPCALRANGLPDPDAGAPVSCLGYCAQGPVLRKHGRYYTRTTEGLDEIRESMRDYVAANAQGLPAYRDGGGYAALERLLAEPDPQPVLKRLEEALLRGMGGAGFPVHLKWKAVLASRGSDRVVVVNAHEGEPGTFKDRLLLEREPHRVLEGALLAALTVGAGRIVVALKTEYANARAVLEASLAELKAYSRHAGFESALPNIELRSVAGSYVTGEETALLEALEGRRGEPRLRPPFPAEVGLGGRPTLVQNVETLAALPRLLAPGASEAPSRILEKDYCLTGDVRRPGAFREPLGIRATSLVERDGATPVEGLKAFFAGGVSGGLLPASKLAVTLDFDAVRREGGGLGTGAILAIGRDRCIVETLENVGAFFATESCGKCVPCRLGTAKLRALMAALREGMATEAALHEGVAVAQVMQETSICALGQVAGKALLDGMKHFREEVIAHTRGACPAGRCPGRQGR